MPIVDWGISQGVMDEFDREKQEQYKPYTGPKPPSGVYRWRITQMMVKAEDEERLPQWLVLLELVPRFSSEKRYKGYKVWFSASIGDNNAFAYTPLCDVLGVTEQQFRRKTMVDEEGKVKSIGRWRNDGKQEILGEIVDNIDENSGKLYTNVRWVGDVSEDQSTVDSDDSDVDDEDVDSDEFDEEEEETPKRRRPAKKAATTRRKRRSTSDDDEF